MLTNNSVTIYHKTLNENTRLEEYTRHVYENAWVFLNTQVNNNADTNKLNVRLAYSLNSINLDDISIGDILVIGSSQENISTQDDLEQSYNIVSIKNNNFGSEQHLHIIGE